MAKNYQGKGGAEVRKVFVQAVVETVLSSWLYPNQSIKFMWEQEQANSKRRSLPLDGSQTTSHCNYYNEAHGKTSKREIGILEYWLHLKTCHQKLYFQRDIIYITRTNSKHYILRNL